MALHRITQTVSFNQLSNSTSYTWVGELRYNAVYFRHVKHQLLLPSKLLTLFKLLYILFLIIDNFSIYSNIFKNFVNSILPIINI